VIVSAAHERGGGDPQLLRELVAATDAGHSVVLATVVGTARSVPRHAGAKMLVHPDGRQEGTIGGGEMESRVIGAAVEMLGIGGHGTRRPRQMDFDLVDPASGDAGVCGGTVTVYLELYMPQPQIVVIGCGHVGRAVIDLAHWLGYHVTALDDRAEVADPVELSAADIVLAGPYDETLGQVPLGEATHIVLVTRNVAVDLDVLPIVLASPARSVGVMGSKRRWDTTRGKLEAMNLAEIGAEALDRVRSPIGLDIDAETPEEIALSILGELVGGRTGDS
jgi:xanthine dehydrogenase accessory factor